MTRAQSEQILATELSAVCKISYLRIVAIVDMCHGVVPFRVHSSIQDYNKVELLSLLLTALYSFKRFCSLPALSTLYIIYTDKTLTEQSWLIDTPMK